jgi:nucleoside recognition membrane protein YjiH
LPLSLSTVQGYYLPEKDLVVVKSFSPMKANFLILRLAKIKLDSQWGLLFKITIEKKGNYVMYNFAPLV